MSSKLVPFDILSMVCTCTSAECMMMCHVCAECPRAPVLSADNCVVSNDRAYIRVEYSETVRVRRVRVFYKEPAYKDWDCVETTDLSRGSANVMLMSLRPAAMYKAYAVSCNDVGDSLPSDELWFTTVNCQHVDARIVSK